MQEPAHYDCTVSPLVAPTTERRTVVAAARITRAFPFKSCLGHLPTFFFFLLHLTAKPRLKVKPSMCLKSLRGKWWHVQVAGEMDLGEGEPAATWQAYLGNLVGQTCCPLVQKTINCIEVKKQPQLQKVVEPFPAVSCIGNTGYTLSVDG